MAEKKPGLFKRLFSWLIPTQARDTAKEVAKHGVSAVGVGALLENFKTVKQAVVEDHPELVAEATSFMNTHLNPAQKKRLRWIKETYHFSKLGAMLYSFKHDNDGKSSKPSEGTDKELTRAEQRFVVWLRGLSEDSPKRGAEILNGIPLTGLVGEFLRSFEKGAAKAADAIEAWEDPFTKMNERGYAEAEREFALKQAHAEAARTRANRR